MDRDRELLQRHIARIKAEIDAQRLVADELRARAAAAERVLRHMEADLQLFEDKAARLQKAS